MLIYVKHVCLSECSCTSSYFVYVGVHLHTLCMSVLPLRLLPVSLNQWNVIILLMLYFIYWFFSWLTALKNLRVLNLGLCKQLTNNSLKVIAGMCLNFCVSVLGDQYFCVCKGIFLGEQTSVSDWPWTGNIILSEHLVWHDTNSIWGWYVSNCAWWELSTGFTERFLRKLLAKKSPHSRILHQSVDF